MYASAECTSCAPSTYVYLLDASNGKQSSCPKRPNTCKHTSCLNPSLHPAPAPYFRSFPPPPSTLFGPCCPPSPSCPLLLTCSPICLNHLTSTEQLSATACAVLCLLSTDCVRQHKCSVRGTQIMPWHWMRGRCLNLQAFPSLLLQLRSPCIAPQGAR